MEDAADGSRHVLTNGKNRPEDWAARGHNFMDSRLYDLAAHCYRMAKDPVRFTVATADGSVMALDSKQSAMKPAQISQDQFNVSHAVYLVRLLCLLPAMAWCIVLQLLSYRVLLMTVFACRSGMRC